MDKGDLFKFSASLVACFVLFVMILFAHKNNNLPTWSSETLKLIPNSAMEDASSNEQSNKSVFDSPTWMNSKAEEMSPQDIFEYASWSNHSSCYLMQHFGGRLVGDDVRWLDGQKAICLLPQSLAPVPNNCIIYSFGIDYDWSFDEAIDAFDCQVYSFDHSMKDMQDKFDHSKNIHFFKIGLGSENSTKNGSKILDFESIRNMLGHKNRTIDYLKIDIEWSEWDVLPQMMKTGQLENVKQIGLEIHLSHDIETLGKYVGILRSMEQDFGMVRFDSKINPGFKLPVPSMDNQTVYMAYEIAWYNQKFFLDESKF